MTNAQSSNSLLQYSLLLANAIYDYLQPIEGEMAEDNYSLDGNHAIWLHDSRHHCDDYEQND